MHDSQGTKQADFKLRDTCSHVEDGEKAAFITFAIAYLVTDVPSGTSGVDP